MMADLPPGARSFGGELRRLRLERGMSLGRLAGLVYYSKGYLSKVENGERSAAPELAARCDKALSAGGALAALARDPRPRRRGEAQRRPAQLPAGVGYFTGRADELTALDELLGQAAAGGAVVISAIGGTAGVGKTALAVQWAHRVAGRFPDGQLYVNLRGFSPSGQPVTPTEAVCGFLDAFGVDPARIPQGLDAQAGLYRTMLAGKRVLVVLDNARDAGQVRPLLPGAPGCLAVVTSRSRLTALVATDGARSLTLGLLTGAESRELLAARLGQDRLAAEPHAVDELIESCAGLPLALAGAAVCAAASPRLPLAELAAQLHDVRGRLDALDTGDPATDVRAVFSWSYQHLTPQTARLFRLLGLHPGRDISTAAAARLAGVPFDQAGRALAELTGTHLLTENSPGRYTLHGLLRAYAGEQAEAEESDQDRRAAIDRVVGHYASAAHASPAPIMRQ